MKKVLALVLALALVLSLCGSVFAEAAEEKPTITILMKVDSNITDIETNAYTKHLESVFGCNLDFVSCSGSDQLGLMIMGGETLPYVINYGLSLEDTWMYAQTGRILPLTKYYSDPDFNGNLVACEQKVPGIYKYVTCPDGEIYCIPQYQRELHSNVNNKLWFNFGWLEKMGLQQPTTPDELYEVLKAFVTGDPNGNGQADEVGIVGNNGLGQADATVFIMNSFIYDDNDEHLLFTDGKVDVAYNKEGWKEGIKFLKKLWDEDLIYHGSFTQDRPTAKAIAVQDDPIICSAFCNSSISLIDQNTEAWRGYEGLEPLTGPEGVSFARYNASYASPHWFVTEDCPEELRDLAVQIGIFMFDPTEEEFIKNRFGIEDVDWSRPKTNKSKYEGFPARYYQLQVIWNMEENSHWQKNAPYFALDIDQGEWDSGDPTDWLHKVPHAVVKYMEHMPKEGEYVPKLIYTDEEIEITKDIRTTLKDYVKEAEIAFVTGQRDIDAEWDSYCAELEGMGLSIFLENAQQAYERLMAQ